MTTCVAVETFYCVVMSQGNHLPKRKNISGQRFGKLTTLEFVRVKNSLAIWRCLCDCGNLTLASFSDLRRGHKKSCGCLHAEIMRAKRGPKHHSFKHGKDQKGYARVSTDTGQRLQHCVIMEKILGRPLRKNETVHHKNGIRDDNRADNLELWTSRHPRGQRVSDLITFAKEILADYT